MPRSAIALVVLVVALASSAQAQELEPRVYLASPVGSNVVVVAVGQVQSFSHTAPPGQEVLPGGSQSSPASTTAFPQELDWAPAGIVEMPKLITTASRRIGPSTMTRALLRLRARLRGRIT